MVKEIKTEEELESNLGDNYIIEFGTPEHCIPCKMTLENLEEIENSKKYDINYYHCDNIDIISKLGYNSVPIVILNTTERKVVLDDTSISMDVDELSAWINKIMIGE